MRFCDVVLRAGEVPFESHTNEFWPLSGATHLLRRHTLL